MYYVDTKLPCQKPMLRQIYWEVQNEPVTKNGVFLSDYFVFFENFVSV